MPSAFQLCSKELNTPYLWNSTKRTIYDTAVKLLGFASKRNADWFNENDTDIHDLITEKNRCFRACLSADTKRNHKRLSQARSNVQHSNVQC